MFKPLFDQGLTMPLNLLCMIDQAVLRERAEDRRFHAGGTRQIGFGNRLNCEIKIDQIIGLEGGEQGKVRHQGRARLPEMAGLQILPRRADPREQIAVIRAVPAGEERRNRQLDPGRGAAQ